MTDKIGRGSLTGNVVRGSIGSAKADREGQKESHLIPMSLFAAWDVDRTPANCVPRLCSLTLSRLTVLKPLGADISSITVAVKLQSSKRTLRSNEIALPGHQLLDTELELSFALQYPHYLKQWDSGNRLQVILQRRKRYKNRTILGYKTLCSGTINMASAMQRTMDVELELYGEAGEAGEKSNASKSSPMARVNIQSLSSQPVDHEDASERLKSLVDNPGGVIGGGVGSGFIRYVDDAMDMDDEDFSDEDSDSDRGGGTGRGTGSRRTGNGTTRPARLAGSKARGKIPVNARQRNLKQKFIALLKRFKITDDLDLEEHEADEGNVDSSKITGADLEMDAGDIEDLIDELENLSDSGPEMDTLSVTSTPKPSLRPFFASSRSLLALDPPSSSPASAFIFPSVYGEARLGAALPGLLERHYSDESSSKRGTGGGDSDSHGESMWGTDDYERESDTPTASSSVPTFAQPSGNAQQPQPPTPSIVPASSSSPPRCSALQLEDKGKDVQRKNRLFMGRDHPKKSQSVSSASNVRDKFNETSPRKVLLEQLVRCMPADDALPDHIIMVSGADLQGCNVASRLVERQQRAVNTIGAADVRATIACLVSKIQKFCNCSAKPPPAVKVVLMGPDSYINCVLRCYVEQFSTKPPDWKNHLKFYVVPLSSSSNPSNSGGSGIGSGGSNNTLARYLATLDRYYSVNFVSDSWRETLDRPAEKMLQPPGTPSGPAVNGSTDVASNTVVSPSKIDVQEVIHRLGRYLTSNGSTVQVPIAEAMITYREPGSDEESTQVFIPFVSEVRIGIAEPASSASAAAAFFGMLDGAGDQQADGQQQSAVSSSGGSGGASSGSPPQHSTLLTVERQMSISQTIDKDGRPEKEGRTKTTPPSSPNISSIHAKDSIGSGGESVELQVDYWLSGSSAVAAAAAARESSITSSAAGGAIGGLAATMAQAVTKRTGGSSESKSSANIEPSSVKYTVKAGFRWIVIQRLPGINVTSNASLGSSGVGGSADSSSLFTMTFGLKEKKQKIMRLGKKKEKEKELESKSQMIEGINRLVCQAKTHHSLLKVVIDGVEWNNVKFFQLSSQCKTHIRHLPVALFTESL